jgi:hypothetical protein
LHGHSSIPPAAAIAAAGTGFFRDCEERALANLDTEQPEECPKRRRIAVQAAGKVMFVIPSKAKDLLFFSV